MIKKINLRFCIAVTVVFISAALFINLSPWGAQGLKNQVAGAEILDFKFGFTLAQAQQLLTQLGESGRVFYRQLLIGVDILFPIIYSVFAFSWMAYLIAQLRLQKWYQLVLVIPIIAMFADLFENFNVISLINQFPNLNSTTVRLASLSNMTKWISCILMIAILIVLAIIYLFRNKKRGGRK